MPRSHGATLCGIEDMTINSTAGATNIIEFWQADRCWVKNVEVYNAEERFIQTYRVPAMRGSTMLHPSRLNSPNNGDGYGVYLWDRSTYCLVEDNIFTEMSAGVLKSQSSCNAVLYNYIWKMPAILTGAFQLGAINCNHGAHGMMDLFEGNMAEQFQNDGYHGSGSHETLFRNWFNGLHPTNHAQQEDDRPGPGKLLPQCCRQRPGRFVLDSLRLRDDRGARV